MDIYHFIYQWTNHIGHIRSLYVVRGDVSEILIKEKYNLFKKSFIMSIQMKRVAHNIWQHTFIPIDTFLTAAKQV